MKMVINSYSSVHEGLLNLEFHMLQRLWNNAYDLEILPPKQVETNNLPKFGGFLFSLFFCFCFCFFLWGEQRDTMFAACWDMLKYTMSVSVKGWSGSAGNTNWRHLRLVFCHSVKSDFIGTAFMCCSFDMYWYN